MAAKRVSPRPAKDFHSVGVKNEFESEVRAPRCVHDGKNSFDQREQLFRNDVTDATANIAMLQAAMMRARTNANKHREARARRAELRSLQSGNDVQVGYFKIGVNTGANLLRHAINAFHRGVCTDDVSGEPLKGEMVVAARKLELEFFEWACTRA